MGPYIQVQFLLLFQGVASKQHKEGSVNKLLILLAVPATQELYHNIKVLLNELNLDTIDFMLTSDLKMGINTYCCLRYKIIFVYIQFSFYWERTLEPAGMHAHTARGVLPGQHQAQLTSLVLFKTGMRYEIQQRKLNIELG